MTDAERRAIEAAQKAHRIAARCFTLEEACNAIATQEGLNETNRKRLLDDMLQSDLDGSLIVRSPTGHNIYAPYRPTTARYFNELTTPEDVNKWAAVRGFSWRWNEPAQVPQGVPAHPAIIRPPKLKRDAIAPVIELAKSQCRDPNDTAEVWAKMEVLADNETAPFLASTKEGLKYTTNGETKYFTRNALDKRLHPEKRGAPGKRR